MLDSDRPSSVVTDPAGSVTVTSSAADGRIVMIQSRFWPGEARCTPVARPLVTSSASSLSFR